MALFHVATLTPSKPEILATWVPTRPWGAPDLQVVGAFRFDDPEGRVGMETHLVTSGDTILHVPLTYRDTPLEGADDALVATMEHSALGTRWVYDGLRDPRFVTMLAAVAMTGQGEALGMADHEGRWYVAPSNVRIHGGGWGTERVPLDGFVTDQVDATEVVLRNDRFDLTVHRRPTPGPRPSIGLTATWDGGPGPIVLAEVTDRSA